MQTLTPACFLTTHLIIYVRGQTQTHNLPAYCARVMKAQTNCFNSFIHHTDFRLIQSVTMTTNSIILLLVLYISCLCSTRNVYIQPSEGEHCPGTPCYNISTFGRMAHNNFSNSSGLVVHFLEGTHLLDLQELVVFTDLTNATFKGDGRMEQGFHETVWQSTVVIKCTEHSRTGIAFVNSSNITFKYITITNCGADMISFTDFLSPSMNSSLGYFNVNNIFIDHVTVQNGSGNGLLIVTDGADLSIAASSFAQNCLVYNPTVLHMAADVFIMYNNPLGCDPHKYIYNALITNTNISDSYSYSRGLIVEISQTTYSVTIILDSVQAHGNGFNIIGINSANVPNYNLIINNSNIQGAPLVILAISHRYTHKCSTNTSKPNITISIVNSKFNYINGNFGSIGIEFEDINYPVTIIINSTEISHNIVTQNVLFILSHAYKDKAVIVLQNVTINNNSCSWAIYDNNITFLQPAAVHTEFVSLVLNNVTITNNNATGLLAYRTVISVNSNSTSIFHNNSGIDGGGLAMYGESYLVFEENSLLHFTNNSANHRGGAIFVSATLLPNSPCFYQYYDGTIPQSTKATFYDNNAEIAGTVLFGGDQNCLIFINPLNFNNTDYFNMTFDYLAQTGPSVISSEPTNVCFCDDNNTINCSLTQLTMTAYPGQEINISVVTVGQRDGVAPGLLKIQPLDLKSAPVEIYNTIAMNCTTIAFTPVHDNYSLSIAGTTGYISTNLTLNINKTDCPLGFHLSKKNGSCDCEEVKHINPLVEKDITCDSATNTLSRQGDIWIGNISECIIVQTPCPLDYCNSTKANFTFADPDSQCAKNRNGTLCGGCKNNFSLALGSNNCIQCNQFSYLALIIPFAAAGFGLVALLMVLNLTVSIGTINGLMFYASIVKISESTGIFFPNGPIPVLSQFIAWLNLDLGIETCFYPGMTAYAKVWLQFVFPLYIWLIIATIIVLCRYSTWLSNKIGSNVVQVLATLILLSFTKIFRTFAPALTWVTLPCKNESAVTAVWYMDGNIAFFSNEHYILMVAAVLCLLLAVPYTLALLFDSVIEKHLTKIRFFRKQWIKFKPFVDAYHGPYKDNCRFWTGLLLLVRMSFTLASLHLDTNTTLVFITTSTSVLLSLMVFFGGVYQKSYLNILECLSFLNLAMLSAIYIKTPHIDVTIISVSVALVMFIGVIVYHVFLRVKIILCFKKLGKEKFNGQEESERLLDDENYVCKGLVEPTSTDVWMKREPLIYS